MKRRKGILFLVLVCLVLWQTLPAVSVPASSAGNGDCSSQPAPVDCCFRAAQAALPPAQIMKVLQFSLQCPVCKVHTSSFFTVYSNVANVCLTRCENAYILAAQTFFRGLPEYAIAYLFIAFW
ncbi:MAG TPA: hypothetical protein DIW30_06055 [Bacteroidales bacterium]|nr:hypothetical protein [Bacteroidales bacterium]